MNTVSKIVYIPSHSVKVPPHCQENKVEPINVI